MGYKQIWEKKKEGPLTDTRMLNIKVTTERDEDKIVIAWIKKYRAAVRKLYNLIVVAKMAGATIEDLGDSVKVVPNDKMTEDILSLYGTPGAMPYYSMREYFIKELMPGTYSYVWDAARAEITANLRAEDPKYPASRDWLIHQLARKNARYLHLPLEIPNTDAVQIVDHGVIAVFDHTIGRVLFKCDTMDPTRWGLWNAIVRGDLPHGSVKLTEWEDVCHMKNNHTYRKHQLRISVSYKVAIPGAMLHPGRELVIPIMPAGKPGFRIRMRPVKSDEVDDLVADINDGDWVGFEHAIAGLVRFETRRKALTIRKADCGNPVKPWGDSVGWEHEQRILSNSTRHRVGFVECTNHSWSRRIALRARDWDCRTIRVIFPANSRELLIGGFPWAWFQFKAQLKYKAKEMGARVVFTEPGVTDVEDLPEEPTAPKTPKVSRKTSRRE
jgi:hypothetical protein